MATCWDLIAPMPPRSISSSWAQQMAPSCWRSSPLGTGADCWDNTAKLLGAITAAVGIRKGADGDYTLLGEEGAERSHGLGGNDSILAGAGDVRLNGGAGADYIDGEMVPIAYTSCWGRTFLSWEQDATSLRVAPAMMCFLPNG